MTAIAPFLLPIFYILFVLILGVSLRKTGRWTQETARAVVGIVVLLAVVDMLFIWWKGAR